MTTPNWTAARARMLLDPSVSNLNTGSFGPLPRSVFEQVTKLRRQLADEPMNFLLRTAPPLLWQARSHLAGVLGTFPRQLVFTANATAAINLVAASLRLKSPGELLLTDHEYGAMVWCWERAARRMGLTVRTFALPHRPKKSQEIVDTACAAMTRRTRLLFFSHVLSPTGMVLPASELCAEARARGIMTVLDGAHAPAFIDVHLSRLGADYYAGNCHKWMLAPTGAGFLHVDSVEHLDRLEPLQVSWGWKGNLTVEAHEPDEFGSTPAIRRLEFEGTRDPCPWLAIQEAIDFQWMKIGRPAIKERIAGLADYVRERIGELGLERVTPHEKNLCGAMTAFRLPPSAEAAALRRRLWEEYRVEVPIIERPDCLYVRVSTHFYNTEEEIDRLAEALTRLLSLQ